MPDYLMRIALNEQHLPLVVECIVDKDNLPGLTEELTQAVTGGIAFTTPVDLILDR